MGAVVVDVGDGEAVVGGVLPDGVQVSLPLSMVDPSVPSKAQS